MITRENLQIVLVILIILTIAAIFWNLHKAGKDE